MTTRRIVLVVLAAGCMALPATASAAAPRPYVAGNRLVDAATNQTFIPRGVNWPSFEYACFYGYAYSDSSESGSVNPDAAGAAVIAGWHVNTVRVPLNQDCWLGEDGSPAFGTVAGYRQAVVTWVQTLHEAGLAVILDLHWSGPAGIHADGQRAMPDDRSDDFWTSVAATFKDDASTMFDLFNEPYSRSPAIDLTWACWRSGGCSAPGVADTMPLDATSFTAIGMEQLVAAVRGAGAGQPILLGGRDYANDLGEWLQNRPNDGQLVASFHNYNEQVCHTAACWDATIAPIAAQVPVVTGEFGENDCADGHLNSYMDWADRHGVGYLGWGWWVLKNDARCQTFALLADPSGTPRAPNGTALKAHLDALVATGAIAPTTGGAPAPSSGARPGAGGGAATSVLRLRLGGSLRQKLRRTLSVTARCSVACTARATGELEASSRRGAATLNLAPASGKGAAGRTITLRLKLSSRARRTASAALRRHGKVIVRLTVRVKDATGTSTSTRRRVRLIR